MIHSFDLILILVFLIAQACIHSLLVAAAETKLTGSVQTTARFAIYLFDIVVIAGFVCSYSEIPTLLGIVPQTISILGAVTLAYLLLATGALAIHTVFLVIRRMSAADANPQRRRILRTAGQVAMAAPAAVLGYGFFIERHQFWVREVDIPSPRLPRDLDGLRILQLSDIHLGAFLSEREFARVIDASNELRPNLAVVTGDLISLRGDPLDACIAQIARLRSDTGTFGCLGNHERYAEAEAYATDAAMRAGIRILRSQTAPLAFGASLLNLVGIDYQRWNPRHEYLRGASRLLAADAWNVLLSHNPDVLPSAAREGYNLVLSGHTHGGQVSVEILDQAVNPARFFTRYIHGLYREGYAAGYVTRGIGTIGLPVRFGAPPEISLLRLRKV